jgi:hypothetical protein
MYQVTGAFAEFERGIIRQRVHAGLKRAGAQGRQLGRPRIDAALDSGPLLITGNFRSGACRRGERIGLQVVGKDAMDSS